jgi:hypothetical protein
MPFSLLMYLKIKLVVLPYLILLTYVYPLEESETFLPSWLTTISRSARQLHVFLLLMLYVRKLDIFNKDKITLVDISQLYLFLHLLDFAWFFVNYY